MKIYFQLLLILFSLPGYAQPAGSAAISLRNKVITLQRFLNQNHYQPVKWNDTSSAMLYNRWIGKLDDEKLFFTQNEMAVLETYKTNLDDEILGKGWEFYDKSIALYKNSLRRTDSLLKVLLAKPFDFSKPDNVSWPFTTYASSVADLNLRAQPLESQGGHTFRDIGTADFEAEVEHHLGNPAHARAADADEVHVFDLVFHPATATQ